MPKYSNRKTSQRIFYAKTHQQAQAVANKLRAKGEKDVRIVRYEKGFAVQLRKSGPYVLKRAATR